MLLSPDFPAVGGTLEDRILLTPEAAVRLRALGHTSLPAPLNWWQRLRILRDTVRALVYLHTPKADKPCTLHLDIKPSNLLLDEGLNVRLADFGLARTSTPAEDSRPRAESGSAAAQPTPTRTVSYGEALARDWERNRAFSTEGSTAERPGVGRDAGGWVERVGQHTPVSRPAHTPSLGEAMARPASRPAHTPSLGEVLARDWARGRGEMQTGDTRGRVAPADEPGDLGARTGRACAVSIHGTPEFLDPLYKESGGRLSELTDGFALGLTM